MGYQYAKYVSDIPSWQLKMRKNKILVVDYDIQVCRMLKRVLESDASEVFTAVTRAQAETHLRKHRITHIVSDFTIREEVDNAYDIVSEWRRQYPWIRRVIILTAIDISSYKVPVEIDAVMAKRDPTAGVARALLS
ncbi:MAG: hypothetical protein QNJ97_14695 [Myxococcota bacterium]|nr:hypothetical protein [Myxococcota bacterium]